MPKKEMTVGDLRRELRALSKKMNALWGLKHDKELMGFLTAANVGPGTRLDDIIALLFLTKLMALYAEYLGLPPGAVELPRREAR